MAKNTHSQEVLTGTPDSYTEDESTDPATEIRFTRPELGAVDRPTTVEEESEALNRVTEDDEEEEVSSPDQDGTDSSQSLQSDQSRTGSNRQHSPKPAPTMESPSEVQGKESDSTVHSTDGDGQKATRPPSGRKTLFNRKSANVRSTDPDDEFDI